MNLNPPSTPTCRSGVCSFSDLVDLVVGFLNSLIPLIVGLIVVFLIWRVVDAWIINAGDQQKRESGKHVILAGVLALVVLTTLWGVVALLRSSFFGV